MYRFVPTALLGALLALALLASTATASVQVGSSGWLWGNPLPQGNTINGISFAGTTGFAAGDFGTILSHDRRRQHVDRPVLRHVHEPRHQSRRSTATRCSPGAAASAVARTTAARPSSAWPFTPVESSCRQKLAAAWFVDTVTGYLVLDDGTVLRTDNNGDTFAQKIAVPGTAAAGGGVKVTDVRFVDANNGLAATTDGKLYRTADGANSWTSVNETQRTIRKFIFLDARRVTRSATARSSSRRTTRGRRGRPARSRCLRRSAWRRSPARRAISA